MGKEDKRRHFTREFKRDAVQLVTEKGMRAEEVARDLVIQPCFSSSKTSSIILGIFSLISGESSRLISRDFGSTPITVVFGVLPIRPDRSITSSMPT